MKYALRLDDWFTHGPKVVNNCTVSMSIIKQFLISLCYGKFYAIWNTDFSLDIIKDHYLLLYKDLEARYSLLFYIF